MYQTYTALTCGNICFIPEYTEMKHFYFLKGRKCKENFLLLSVQVKYWHTDKHFTSLCVQVKYPHR